MRLLSCPADLESLRESLRDLAVASEGKTRRTWLVLGPLEDDGGPRIDRR